MSAAVVRNGDGAWYATCRACKWRSGTHEGLLAPIDAQDEADDHDRQNHD